MLRGRVRLEAYAKHPDLVVDGENPTEGVQRTENITVARHIGWRFIERYKYSAGGVANSKLIN